MKNSILLSAVIVLLVTLFSPAAQAQRPNNPTGSETTTATTPTRGTATRTTRPSVNRGTTTRSSASNRGTRTGSSTPRPRTNTTPRPQTNTTPRPRTNNFNYCPPGGNARNGNAQSTRRTGGSFGTQFGGEGRGTRTRPGSSNGTTIRVRSTNDTRGKEATRSRRANRSNSDYDEVYGDYSPKVVKSDKVKVSASRRNR
ncbi:MAG: hypothetical protein OTI34_05050 [Lewinella sp.]|nr:hypothetical protein [Lewinella sp.]